MTTVTERQFHLLMGALVLGSLFLDGLAQRVLPAWHPPQVSLITLVLGLVWVALFAGYRGRNLEQRLRVLEDRLERGERKVAALEAEAAERHHPPLR